MGLQRDSSNETIAFAVNGLREAIEHLEDKVDDAIDTRQLETNSLRERLTRLEERAVTKRMVYTLITTVAAGGLSGWILFLVR